MRPCSQLFWIGLAGLGLMAGARADSTINPLNASAWSPNVGWINCRADIVHGAIVGEFVCSGFLYSGATGWISLGSGTPANGIAYQNNSAIDFGVNQNGLGNLQGLAWGANIGWLIFTNRDAAGAPFDGPRVDLATGRLSGFAFSANTGWISLSNAVAFVQTDRMVPGRDSDNDGIADAFELTWTGSLTGMNASSDLDGDASSDLAEYLASTNPTNPGENLRVTALSVGSGGTNLTATWTTQPTRFYHVQQRLDFTTNSLWTDSGLGLVTPDAAPTSTRAFPATPASQRFIRVEAVRPLPP